MLTVMIVSMVWFFFIVGLVCAFLTCYYAVTGDSSNYSGMVILIKVLSICFIIVLAGAIGAKAVGL